MAVVGHQPPPFFKRGPAPLVRLVFFISLSLALLIVDLQFRYLELVRQGVAVLTYPLQRLAYVPVDSVKGASEYFVTLSALREDNAELKRRHVEAAADQLRQEQLVQENQRLRALLEMRQRHPAQGVVAEIIYNARDPFSRKVIIDKGLQHGIAAGQAVVDDAGVLGQVTRAFPLQSEVTLISDKEQAVPIQIARNGLRAVLFGAGAGQLELRYLAANADVQTGDTLVTSGLDGVYVSGLPVARVVRIDRDTSYTFAHIVCLPIAGVEQHGMVLVLNRHEVPPAPPEIEEKPKSAKPGKKRRQRE
jgi:rod shape-determining protein MreC